LARQNVAVTPTPLRVIFTMVPPFIAAHYWQRQLNGPLGTVAIAPHVRATRNTEFPQIAADVRRLVAGHGPTPHLDRLLDIAGNTP
jgi:2-dehydropantoate 2-reductase